MNNDHTINNQVTRPSSKESTQTDLKHRHPCNHPHGQILHPSLKEHLFPYTNRTSSSLNYFMCATAPLEQHLYDKTKSHLSEKELLSYPPIMSYSKKDVEVHKEPSQALEKNIPTSQSSSSSSPTQKRGAVDDLDASFHNKRNKRRKYQRRNSFIVHNRSSLNSSGILNNIRAASASLSKDFNGDDDDNDGANQESNRKMVTGIGKERTQDMKDDEDKVWQDHWGNASWSNSDDTQWYNELASLSFESKAKVATQPLLAVSLSEDTMEDSQVVRPSNSNTRSFPVIQEKDNEEELVASEKVGKNSGL